MYWNPFLSDNNLISGKINTPTWTVRTVNGFGIEFRGHHKYRFEKYICFLLQNLMDNAIGSHRVLEEDLKFCNFFIQCFYLYNFRLLLFTKRSY